MYIVCGKVLNMTFFSGISSLNNSVFYLLIQNKVIVPGEKQKSYPGKNIFRKDPMFADRSSRQTVQTEIILLIENVSD